MRWWVLWLVACGGVDDGASEGWRARCAPLAPYEVDVLEVGAPSPFVRFATRDTAGRLVAWSLPIDARGRFALDAGGGLSVVDEARVDFERLTGPLFVLTATAHTAEGEVHCDVRVRVHDVPEGGP